MCSSTDINITKDQISRIHSSHKEIDRKYRTNNQNKMKKANMWKNRFKFKFNLSGNINSSASGSLLGDTNLEHISGVHNGSKTRGKHYYNNESFRTYSCIHCRTQLATHDELVSKLFQGNQGRAYLFNKVVNVNCRQAVRRQLLTGPHEVADIYCANCETTLGWKYEQAFVASQKYKEGKYIIELIHMFKLNQWDINAYNSRAVIKEVEDSSGPRFGVHDFTIGQNYFGSYDLLSRYQIDEDNNVDDNEEDHQMSMDKQEAIHIRSELNENQRDIIPINQIKVDINLCNIKNTNDKDMDIIHNTISCDQQDFLESTEHNDTIPMSINESDNKNDIANDLYHLKSEIVLNLHVNPIVATDKSILNGMTWNDDTGSQTVEIKSRPLQEKRLVSSINNNNIPPNQQDHIVINIPSDESTIYNSDQNDDTQHDKFQNGLIRSCPIN